MQRLHCRRLSQLPTNSSGLLTGFLFPIASYKAFSVNPSPRRCPAGSFVPFTTISRRLMHMAMHTMLDLCSASKALSPDEAFWTTPGTTHSKGSLTGTLMFLWTRPWLSYATALLHVLTAVFAVLYSFGSVAVGIALLCYAFSR